MYPYDIKEILFNPATRIIGIIMLANSRAIHLGGNVRLYIRSQQNTLYRSRTSFFPRHSSTIVEPTPPFQRARTFLRYTGYASLSTVFGVLAFGAGLFIHDAFTYTEKHIDRVPVSPLALKPERGGPKNLPIVRVQVDDEDDEENARLADKPKLVIVGGGWGVSLSSLPFTKSDIKYHRRWACSKLYMLGNITLQLFHRKPSQPSHRSFHVRYTPSGHNQAQLFCSLYFEAAAVGTVQIRSLIEPIRKIIARLRGHFVQGKAVDLVMSERLLEVETAGGKSNIYIPYVLNMVLVLI